MFVIPRIYTGGSPVCHKTVLDSLKTRRRIGTGMFCPVSAPHSVVLSLLSGATLIFPKLRLLWVDLFCPSPAATLLSFSDDATRVVLQGQEDYINASHITVNTSQGNFLSRPYPYFSVTSY